MTVLLVFLSTPCKYEDHARRHSCQCNNIFVLRVPWWCINIATVSINTNIDTIRINVGDQVFMSSLRFLYLDVMLNIHLFCHLSVGSQTLPCAPSEGPQSGRNRHHHHGRESKHFIQRGSHRLGGQCAVHCVSASTHLGSSGAKWNKRESE